MGADQSRSRPRGWVGLACLVALAVGVSLAIETSASGASGTLGSSCASPYVLSESYGNRPQSSPTPIRWALWAGGLLPSRGALLGVMDYEAGLCGV